MFIFIAPLFDHFDEYMHIVTQVIKTFSYEWKEIMIQWYPFLQGKRFRFFISASNPSLRGRNSGQNANYGEY